MAKGIVYRGEPPEWSLPGPAIPFTVQPGPGRMRRQTAMTREEIIAYNLREDGNEFTIFEVAQPDRVDKARAIIRKLLGFCSEPAVIVELGCSTGDIGGFFSEQHAVTGVDVTPGAVAMARRKWPRMLAIERDVGDIVPVPCDILVLTEFLEHVIDPVKIVTDWLPRAKYVVIGHPLVGDDADPEVGHPWAYYDVDFANWFPMGGHELREAWTFPMGYRMVIGWGENER